MQLSLDAELWLASKGHSAPYSTTFGGLIDSITGGFSLHQSKVYTTREEAEEETKRNNRQREINNHLSKMNKQQLDMVLKLIHGDNKLVCLDLVADKSNGGIEDAL